MVLRPGPGCRGSLPPPGAAQYAFVATVTEVQAGSQPGQWELDYQVGQTIQGTVGFDATLTPSGFTNSSMTTSVFLHATTYASGITLPYVSADAGATYGRPATRRTPAPCDRP